MPSCRTTGNKMGVKIKMAGVISINIPTTSNIALMVNKITTGLFESPIKVAETVCGIFAIVMIQDIALDAPINNITTAVVSPV